MNKLRFIILSVTVALLTVGCGKKSAGNSEKESADSVKTEMQSAKNDVATPQAATFDPAAMPQLKPLDKLTAADMTGVKAYGLYGRVKTAKFKGEYEYTIKFSKEGNDSEYKSEVAFGKNSRKEIAIGIGVDGADKVGEDKFDQYGRVISSSSSDGLDGNTTTYTYKGTNAFPDSKKTIVYMEGGDGTYTITRSYKYKEFDKYGNWIKRTENITEIEESVNGEQLDNKTKTNYLTAEYTYYE